MYGWDAARQACPAGWHLASDAEWTALVNYAGGDEKAGKKLKARSGWSKNNHGTDDYGFSALPGGSAGGNGHYNLGYEGNWWSATKSSWYMKYDDEGVGRYDDAGYESSVRCVQD